MVNVIIQQVFSVFCIPVVLYRRRHFADQVR
jgi:hypothetical protein